MGHTTEKILFFDGICVMCNKLVHFVLRHDKNRTVKFATLQGNVASDRLPAELREGVSTVVFVDEQGIHTQSDAIIRLLYAMGGALSAAVILRIFPKFLRDAVYRFIARHRYRWFGTTESCAILSLDERKRVLD